MPDFELVPRYEMYTGSWVDITAHVRVTDDQASTRGRPDEGSQSDPGQLRFQLNNRDGRYSPRNPSSPYFELIGRNTPVRMAVKGSPVHLRVPDTAGARARVASTTALNIAGDLDVRVELALDRLPQQAPAGSSVGPEWSVSAQEVIGRYNGTANARMWRLLVGPSGEPRLTWSTTGTDFIERAATASVPYSSGQRCALRATLDVNNGSSGHTVTFYVADTIAGPWRQLGDPVTTSGTTSINTTGTVDLEVGDISTIGFARGAGRYYRAEVRSGIGGTLVASPDFTAQTVGASSFVDGAGRTWLVENGATITDWHRRFVGEISAWPSRWDVSDADVWVEVEASGPLRRLGQGQKALASTLRRRVPSADPAPLVYWPMEDGQAATSAASALPDSAPLSLTDVSWAADDTLGGSAALPTLGQAARLYGTVTGAAAGGWHAEMVYKLDTMPATEQTMLRLYLAGAGGGVAAVRVRCSTAGIRIQALDADDGVIAQFLYSDAGALAAFTGSWQRLQLFSYFDGTDTYPTAGWRDIANNVYWRASTVYTGAPGRVTAVRGAWGTDFQGTPIGHLGVWDVGGTSTTAPGIAIYDGADDGFTGESSAGRARRLAGEERLTVASCGLTAETTPMGPQRPAPLLDLLQECADADGGVLGELREAAGLQLRPRVAAYNRPVALALDYTAGHIAPPLEPTDDDQAVRNDITVSRPGGSSARAVLEDGPLSVQAPPNGVGIYDESVEVNVATDGQLAGIAGWRLHLGTVDELRYPTLTLNLANTRMTAAREAVLNSVDIGSRITIANPPSWLPPGPIDLVVEGYEETLNTSTWQVTYTCTPARPWTVGEVGEAAAADDDAPTHVDTDGSQLAAAATSTGTTLTVLTTAGPEWATTTGPTVTAAAGDYPVDLALGGEVVTATAVQPAAWDTYTRTVSNSWGTSTSGHTWAETGGAASDRSVSGTQGVITLAATPDTRRVQRLTTGALADCEVLVAITPSAVATGASFIPGVLLRASGANDYVVRLLLDTAGGVRVDLVQSGTLIATGATAGTYAASTKLWLRARVDGDRVRGRAWRDGSPEPGRWHLDHTVSSSPIATGEVGIVAHTFAGNTNVSPQFSFDDFAIVRPQNFTVTRSTNGITKSHSAAADVRLADPMIIAL